MSKDTKPKPRNPATTRTPLEKGWKMRSYKLNPHELHIIDQMRERGVSGVGVINRGIRLVAKQEGLK